MSVACDFLTGSLTFNQSFYVRDTVTSEPIDHARRLVHVPEQSRTLVRMKGQGMGISVALQEDSEVSVSQQEVQVCCVIVLGRTLLLKLYHARLGLSLYAESIL